jgi:hypothetical protein
MRVLLFFLMRSILQDDPPYPQIYDSRREEDAAGMCIIGGALGTKSRNVCDGDRRDLHGDWKNGHREERHETGVMLIRKAP